MISNISVKSIMYSDVWSFWVLHKLGLFCFVFVFASQFAVCLQVFWTPPNTTGGDLLCRDYPYIWIIPFHTLLRLFWVWFDSCCSSGMLFELVSFGSLVYYKLLQHLDCNKLITLVRYLIHTFGIDTRGLESLLCAHHFIG